MTATIRPFVPFVVFGVLVDLAAAAGAAIFVRGEVWNDFTSVKL